MNVVPVELPPLRERKNDILLIADYFLGKFNCSFKKTIKGFDQNAKSKLLSYSWPGNIRELKNVIERIVILSSDEWITSAKLPPEVQNFKGDNLIDQPEEEVNLMPEDHFSLDFKLDSIEKRYIVNALDKWSGNQTKSSRGTWNQPLCPKKKNGKTYDFLISRNRE